MFLSCPRPVRCAAAGCRIPSYSTFRDNCSVHSKMSFKLPSFGKTAAKPVKKAAGTVKKAATTVLPKKSGTVSSGRQQDNRAANKILVMAVRISMQLWQMII